MIATIDFNPFARVFAERLVNCAIEGLAIGLFAWVLLRVAGRRNSSTRFAVWFSALLAIALLSLVGSLRETSAAPASAAPAFTLSSSWALSIFVAWAAIASIALLRVGMGLLQLRNLRASCVAIDTATLDPVLQNSLHEVQTLRPVTLCRSSRVQVPTAVGFLKPLVVLPTWAMAELSASDLNSILIHELAHLRRWDDWTNLAQQVVKALLFFHPAVWWIESKLTLEREMACDDAVLAATPNPRGYAECLISIAEKSFLKRGIALAQAAVTRVRQTSLRVAQILDVNRPGATRVWRPALYSIGAFSMVCLLSLAHAPELVAFEDNAPSMTVASTLIPSGTSFSASESRLQREGTTVTAVRLPVNHLGLIHRSAKARARHGGPAPDSSKTREARMVAAANRKSESNALTDALSIENNIVAPQTIFVVMKSEQYTQGELSWQIRVWQVTVFDSSHIPVESRTPAKKI